MTFLFWMIALALLSLGLIVIIVPLFLGYEDPGVDREKLNVEIYKDKLTELDSDLKAGKIIQDQYGQAVADLKQGLLADVGEQQGPSQPVRKALLAESQLALLLLFAVPLGSIGIYKMTGTPIAEVIAKRDAPQQQIAGHQDLTPEQMVKSLRDNVNKDPTNPKGWIMLARLYQYMNQPQDIEKTYLAGLKKTNNSNNIELKADYANFLNQKSRNPEAIELLEQLIKEHGETNADVLAHYADALGTRDNSLRGKPYELVKKAILIQPVHQKALWLAGTAAFQEQEFKTALNYWETLAEMLKPGSEDAKMLGASITQAKEKLGIVASSSNVAAVKEPSNAGGSTTVSGSLTLADKFVANVQPEDTVFIFAKAVRGPRMPLAVIRLQAKDLPYQFTLSEANSMDPSFSLAQFKKVLVTARVSKSGNAIEQPGDLFGSTAVIAVGSNNLVLEINQISAKQSRSNALANPQATQPSQAQTSQNGSPQSISGIVSLAPQIAAKAAPTDTLFVFAKATQGPPMPLAVIRKQVKDLPLKFTLDDSKAMSPQLKISNFANVVVTARVSKSGTAMRQSGDLTSASPVIKVGSEKLDIKIDTIVP